MRHDGERYVLWRMTQPGSSWRAAGENGNVHSNVHTPVSWSFNGSFLLPLFEFAVYMCGKDTLSYFYELIGEIMSTNMKFDFVLSLTASE